jgi:predicted pyridoxine 5'-phosphate oxidase superfamily flavin-nucleotide-binding protein
MAQNFTTYTFTESVKKAQEKYGSRSSYEKMENKGADQFQIFQRETAHIQRMDSFYLSTVNKNGWPYVQFRGGPKGFLKIIDRSTLGYADFRGNMQYISTGNINDNNRVSMILLDYPSKTRLKIWAETEILEPDMNLELSAKLIPSDYQAKIERLVIFHIKAFDWNCPQHITPKYTLKEMKELLKSDNDVRAYLLEEGVNT